MQAEREGDYFASVGVGALLIYDPAITAGKPET